MQASEWDSRYAASDLVWSAGPNIFVERECAGLVPGRALDLGSGEGRNAIWLASLGWTVTAVDFSAVASQRAAARAGALGEGGGRVTAVTADVLDYQPDPGVYDLVLLAYLQLPVEQRRAVLGTAASALAPGGTLLFVAHHADNIEHGVGGPDNPAVLCTQDDVAGDLAAIGGFVVERAELARRSVGPAPEAGHQHGLDRGGAAGEAPEVRHALDVVVRARREAS